MMASICVPTHVAQPAWLADLCRYIATHTADDLTLSDLAAEADVTPRMLQYAFKQHLHTTPMRWLRLQRLQQVNQVLCHAKEVNVTQAAMAGGFTNLGVFARYYHDQFGELPSQTLSAN